MRMSHEISRTYANHSYPTQYVSLK